MNATVYRTYPGVVTVAEESTAWPGVSRPTHLGGLGFGFKWNMGWMHDTLDYIGATRSTAGYHHNQMTFSLMYAFSENFVLPISHDEVVHGKGSLWERMPGDPWNKAANRAGAAGVHVGASGQAAAVHGQASSARTGSGPRIARSTGACSATRCTRHQVDGRRHQPGLQGQHGPVDPGQHARGLLLDRRRTTRAATC
jgi:hypothetical protein